MNEHEIDVGGVRVWALEHGAGGVVLFVHGWAASRKFWREAVEAAGATHRAVAVDLPGFGGSAAAGEGTIAAYAGFVGKLIETLGGPVDALVGHSMGGMVAAKLALERPELMRRLVLVSAPVCGPTALHAKARVMLWPVVRLAVYAALRTRWGRRMLAKDFTYARPLPDELIDGIVQGQFSTLVRSAKSLMATDLTAGLTTLRVPAMVIAGDRDALIKPEQYELQRAIPDVRMEMMAETGHCPMVERAGEFNERLLHSL